MDSKPVLTGFAASLSHDINAWFIKTITNHHKSRAYLVYHNYSNKTGRITLLTQINTCTQCPNIAAFLTADNLIPIWAILHTVMVIRRDESNQSKKRNTLNVPVKAPGWSSSIVKYRSRDNLKSGKKYFHPCIYMNMHYNLLSSFFYITAQRGEIYSWLGFNYLNISHMLPSWFSINLFCHSSKALKHYAALSV